MDWFPRLRTSSLEDTVDADASAYEIKKLSSLLDDTKKDLKMVVDGLKSLQKKVIFMQFYQQTILGVVVWLRAE